MNIAIQASNGDFILRLDAHSFYPNNYLQICLETALETQADNVGGLVETIPGGDTYSALLVQSLTTHWFGVGNSGFRIGAKAGPRDTVPYGFFKRSIFDKVGLYDERLVRAQDYELNTRITKSGGLIWLNPEISLTYKNQASLLAFYKKQFFLEAPYNAYMWWIEKQTFNLRHSVTGFFSFGFLAGCFLSPFLSFISYLFMFVMILYSCLAIFQLYSNQFDTRLLFIFYFFPCAFFVSFSSWTWSLKGCALLIFANKAPVQNI
jgi:hypothetical protein